jgi:hypothetical protein
VGSATSIAPGPRGAEPKVDTTVHNHIDSPAASHWRAFCITCRSSCFIKRLPAAMTNALVKRAEMSWASNALSLFIDSDRLSLQK